MSQSPKSPRKTRGLQKPKNYQELGNRDKAIYIVKKYVNSKTIDWKRDLFIAYKLLEKCPELSFWQSLVCRFKIDTLVPLWSKVARQKLENEYRRFKEELEKQKRVVIPVKEQYILSNDKVGEDIRFEEKPRNIIEFCK